MSGRFSEGGPTLITGVTPIVVGSSGVGKSVSITPATTIAAGSMSAADKANLDAAVAELAGYNPTTLGLLQDPPRGRVFTGPAIAIPNAAWTSWNWVNSSYNTPGAGAGGSGFSFALWNAGAQAGLYAFTATITLAPSTAGTLRGIAFWLNGVTTLSAQQNPAPGVGLNATLSLAMEYPLAAGESMQLRVYQDSGAALNLTFAAMTARWVSP